MTIQCGITILRERYRNRFDREFPASDDNIFDVLEAFDMPPVRFMNLKQIWRMLNEMHQITQMLDRLDKLDASNRK